MNWITWLAFLVGLPFSNDLEHACWALRLSCTLANHIFTEPFEANFVLDVAERGLRDMLAVTKEFHDPSIRIPDYQVFQRRVSLAEENIRVY